MTDPLANLSKGRVMIQQTLDYFRETQTQNFGSYKYEQYRQPESIDL